MGFEEEAPKGQSKEYISHLIDSRKLEELRTVGHSFKRSQKTLEALFTYFVRRSSSTEVLDCLLANFPFSDRLKAKTPLIAARWNNLPIVRRLLVTYMIYPEDLLYRAFCSEASRVIKYLFSKHKDFYVEKAKRHYDLIIAAQAYGYKDFTRQLLTAFEKAGVNLFNPANNEDEYWEKLWRAGFTSRDTRFLKLLLKRGANVNQIICKEEGLTPIQVAVEYECADLIECLAKGGADLNHISYQKAKPYFSPLSAAVLYLCTKQLAMKTLYECVKVMVKYGADHTMSDKKGNTLETLMASAIEADYHESIYDSEKGKQEREGFKKQAITWAKNMLEQGVKDGLAERELCHIKCSANIFTVGKDAKHIFKL